MNAEERQALRGKHQPCTCGACYDEGPECVWCAEMDWPCDVIKVLDATENLKFNDLKTEVECDHMVYVNEGKPVLMHASLRVTYCPKCGEKL